MIKKLKQLYEYRELLISLAIRELKVKYKNSALGFFWSLLNPLLTMLVFTFIFSFVFKANTKNFPIFFLIGYLPWNFFALTVSRGSGCIVESSNLIKKVFFPREIIPLSIVLANLINFMLELLVLFVFLLIYGYNFFTFIPLLLVTIVLQVFMTAGFSLALASFTVYFRDIQQIIGIIMMVWFYATPVVYPLEMIPKNVQAFIKFGNPMTSILVLYRESLYNLRLPSFTLVLYAIAASFLIFVAGYLTFNKLSVSFAREV